MNHDQTVEAWREFQTSTHFKRPENDTEYEQLQALMHRLIDHYNCDEEPTASLLYLVGTYMDEYELEHDADLKDVQVEPRQMLAFYMEQQGVTQYQLDTEGVASQSVLSRVLSGEREVSKALAKKLAERFDTSVEVFL
ncbi:MAG: helix-turn-helix domain-containing protein [Trueperaceae bacterium]|nr:helix-turn-helix domain-containing protein [Trueperaceae bacterium]